MNNLRDNGLQIVNGQFVKDGQVIKPQFGDREQIQVLRKAVGFEEAIERQDEGLPVNFETKQTNEETTYYYRTDINFTCLCGHKFKEYHDEHDSEEWGIEDDLSESEKDSFSGHDDFKCPTCAREYLVEKQGGEVKAFLQNN